MNPTKTFDVVELGKKEEVAGLYYRNLADLESRKCHPVIQGWTSLRAANSPEA
jgi:hypothetical protein